MEDFQIPSPYLEAVKQINGNVLLFHRIFGGYICLSSQQYLDFTEKKYHKIDFQTQQKLDALHFFISCNEHEKEKYTSLLASRTSNAQSGDNLRCLELSVSESCNFRCTYCTFWRNKAEKGVSVMHPNIAVSIVQDFIATLPKERRNGKRPLIYFGTGEPLLNWKAIKKVVEYVRGIPGGSEINLSLITNGSLVTKEKLEFLKLHNVSVGISLDGPPDIQRIQRPAASPNVDSGTVVLDALCLAREIGFQFSSLSATYDTPGFEQHARYVLDLCSEYSIPEFDLDYDIGSLHENSDVEQISEEILACYYAARARNIGVFGYWIVPYENIIQNKKNIPEFCQNYSGESVCITPKGEFKLCGYEPASIGAFSNIRAALKSKVYPEKILLNEQSVLKSCKNCEIEGVCAGQCPISPRNTVSWSSGCELYRMITKKLLQNHLDSIP